MEEVYMYVMRKYGYTFDQLMNEYICITEIMYEQALYADAVEDYKRSLNPFGL